MLGARRANVRADPGAFWGGLRADREPPTAFSLRVESAPMARGVSGKTRDFAPIIGAAMYPFVPASS